MSRMSDDEALELVRSAMATDRRETAPDMWPRVRTRIDEGHAPSMTIDWLLVVAALVLIALQPAVVGILLLHF